MMSVIALQVMKNDTNAMPVLDSPQIAFGAVRAEVATVDVVMVCASEPLLCEGQFTKFTGRDHMMPILLCHTHVYRLVSI